jgi:O-antigen/teichoic acid export membrane protein
LLGLYKLGIAQSTIKGIFWVYASFLGGRLFTLISTAILARLLLPDDFGVIGFALIFFAFIEVARNFGVNEALIYSSDNPEDTADTVFIINIVLGLGQFLLAFFGAPLLSGTFDDPRVVMVVQVLSFTFIIEAFGQTHDALLQKELEFRRRFLPDLLSAFIKGIVSIVLALTGFGLTSLLIGNLVGSVVRTIAKWWVLPWRPRWRFFPERVKALWGYSVHILLFQLLGVALDQADQVMIGFLLGQTQLGYYSIAMRIPELIIANFSLLLTRVLFPSYVKLKDDIQALTRSFIETTRYTGFITIPVGFGLAAIAPELMVVVFGYRWIEAIPLLQILALMGTMSTLPWSVGDIFKAIGRPDISTRLLVIESLYTFPLIYFMVQGSNLAVMAALANLIALTMTAILRLWWVTYYLEVRPFDFVRMFSTPFLAAGIMFAGVTLWRDFTSETHEIFILVSSIVISALIYAVLMVLLERKSLLNAYDLLKEMIQERRKRKLAESIGE